MLGQPSILHLLKDACEIIHPAAVDQWGEPAGATTTEIVPCRFEFEARMVLDSSGQEVVAAGEAFLDHVVTVEPTARIRYPVGGKEYTILRREFHKRGDLPTHWEVWVK
ncbi:MAG: hypothetical protein WC683_04585 [bacterium]